MPIYDIVYILTMPIFLLGNQKMISCFFGELRYGKKVEFVSYLTYGISMVAFYSFIRVPILLLIFNVLFLFLITFNYDSKVIYKLVSVISIYIFFISIEITVAMLTSPLDVNMRKNLEYTNTVGLVLIRILTLVLAHLFVKIKRTYEKEISLPIYYYIAQLVILVGLLYMYLISIERIEVSNSQTIIISFIIVSISGITVLVDEKVYCSSQAKWYH